MMALGRTVIVICLLGVWGGMLLTACESMKKSSSILPVKEYERLLLGDLNADYVGMDNCLKVCHAHDQLRTYFEASTMGARLNPDSGMPLVDCESCHGPGSLAIAGLTSEKIAADKQNGIRTTCDYDKLIDIKNLPAGARSLICLKCHSSHALFNLHNWPASVHAQSDVSCSECHPIHAGPDLTTRPGDVPGMCFGCHPDKQAQFHLPSHHPVGTRMFCNDCHEPHGGILDSHLRGATPKEVCVRCHRDKGGPFLYEHADNNDDCLTCHRAHGAVNRHLLRQPEPFLCLQCHTGHRMIDSTGGPISAERKGAFYTRCTDCHAMIHGSDYPSTLNNGRFTR